MNLSLLYLSDDISVRAARAVCAVVPCGAAPEIVVWAAHGEESLDLCGPHYLDMVREVLRNSTTGRLVSLPPVTAWVPPQRSA